MKSYTRKANKYGAKKTQYKGITFDSKFEASRWAELLLMQRAGLITSLERQKRFELQPTFKKNGQTFRSITYVADFVYFDVKNNCVVVEDTKSEATASESTYRIKKKLFEYHYPDLTIREIMRR